MTGSLPVPAVRGGAVENLVQTLLDENEMNPKFNFTIFTPKDSDAELAANRYSHSKFVFIDIPKKGMGYIFRVLLSLSSRILPFYQGNYFIRKTINKIKSIHGSEDAIIVENAPRYAILLRKAFPQSVIISHLHNLNVYRGVAFEKDIAQSNDAFFCVSEFICKATRACLKNQKETVYCLYNGIDTKRFSQNLQERERLQFRRTLGLKDDDFVFLFSGRLVPAKGIDELIRAFRIFRHRHPASSVKLLIVGSAESSNFWKKCQGQADASIVFSGRVDYSEMWKYLSVGDVAVLPTIIEEALPLSCIEAHCAGLPCIITNSGGMVEIPANDSAVIVRRGKDLPQHLANAMDNLFHSPEMRRRMSASAQARGKEFSKEAYWSRFCLLVEKLMN